MREMSSEQQRSQGVFVYFVGSQVQVMDKTLSSTSLVHMTRSFTNPIHPTNHSRSLTDAHNTLNYPLYIAVPVGVFGLILFLILLVRILAMIFISISCPRGLKIMQMHFEYLQYQGDSFLFRQN